MPVLDHFDEDDWEEIQARARRRRRRTRRRPSSSTCVSSSIAGRGSSRRSRRSRRAPGPVVFHCHGGKDRTGLVAALLLRLAGVPIEEIAEDYALSGDPARAAARRSGSPRPRSDEERARIERIARHARRRDARPCSSRSTGEYGGVERYLLDGGLSPDAEPLAAAALRELRGATAGVHRDLRADRVSGKSAVAEAIARQDPGRARSRPTRRSSTAGCRS